MYGVLNTDPEEVGELVLLTLKADICIISLHWISDKEKDLLGASNNCSLPYVILQSYRYIQLKKKGRENINWLCYRINVLKATSVSELQIIFEIETVCLFYKIESRWPHMYHC